MQDVFADNLLQFCGVNVIAYYSTNIFVKAGFSLDNALLVSFGTGVTNWLFAVCFSAEFHVILQPLTLKKDPRHLYDRHVWQEKSTLDDFPTYGSLAILLRLLILNSQWPAH